MRIFSTTWSPGCGSRPATGAAPQVPRTIALASTSPSNSGALSVTPGAPGSTMNQTWMIITPRERHASARRRIFSMTFCSRACCGEPEAANAPPSITTSFCMSWMMSAQREGSSLRPPCALARSGAADAARSRTGRRARAHERLDARADLGAHGVERMGGAHEQGAPVRLAPMQIGDQLRHPDLADAARRSGCRPIRRRARSPRCCRRCRISCRRARRARARSGCRRRKCGRAPSEPSAFTSNTRIRQRTVSLT